jgi:hypothetical protein
VGAGPVTAAFFNFHPGMVGRAVPACWDTVAPSTLVTLRAAAAAEALRHLCPPPSLAALAGALPLLRQAAWGVGGEGRMLAGANRELWSSIGSALTALGLGEHELGVAEAWQACTTLREHRGDGHVAALVSQGLSGLEAHLLVSGTEGTAVEILRDNRGWSEAEWRHGGQGLAGRGLLQADGTATERGHEVRRSVEALTERLAEPAYAALSDDEVGSLHRALRAAAGPIQASELLPFPNPMGLPRL